MMDSEHRHELKRNELAEWIAKLPEHIKEAPEYLKERWWEALCIVLIVIGLIMWLGKSDKKVVRDVKKQSEMTQLYKQLTTTKVGIVQGKETAGALLALSGQLADISVTAKTPDHEALALIKSGDALRSDLHYRIGLVDEATVKEQTVQAKQKYEEALSKVGDNKTIEAMAKFGIALCAEEVGDFDTAVSLYSEIAENKDYQATLFVNQAQNRLADIADSETKFEFKYVEPTAKEEVEETEAVEVEAVEAPAPAESK